MAQAPRSTLVYSTETGRICPDCGQAQAQCVCRSQKKQVIGNGQVRVSRDTKGRGGKAVTLVRGLPLDEAALIALGKQLRTACGSGGTVKEGVIEVQGDHVERVVAWLLTKGFEAKRAGG